MSPRPAGPPPPPPPSQRRGRYTQALGIEDPMLSIEFCICRDCGAYVATSYTEEHDAYHTRTEPKPRRSHIEIFEEHGEI